jgi:hypothetical protein
MQSKALRRLVLDFSGFMAELLGARVFPVSLRDTAMPLMWCSSVTLS